MLRRGARIRRSPRDCPPFFVHRAHSEYYTVGMLKSRIRSVKIQGVRHSFSIFGEGPVQVVVLTALGSLQAEWWSACSRLSEYVPTLVYDRAGYPPSGKAQTIRSPQNIAKELSGLLEAVNAADKVVIIGHSQGGLYAVEFAMMNPSRVRAVVLLDPLSPHDSRFRAFLTEDEFRASGIDKSSMLRTARILTSFGIGFLLRPLLKKGPPFYYCDDFSVEESRYILRALTSSRLYQTAEDEYRLAHQPEYIDQLKDPTKFPDVPLRILTHSSERVTQEIIEFGGANASVAEKIEALWQDLMQHYLEFSTDAIHVQSDDAAHYIHLSDWDLVQRQIASCLEKTDT